MLARWNHPLSGIIGPDVFIRVDSEPLATASVAQIHPALLRDGREVVVKVRRPGIVDQVEVDLDLLRSGAGLLERRSEAARMLQLEALADELETHLRSELDLAEEASNADLIAESVKQFRELVVPRVVRPHVTERVFVLERVRGEKVSARHALPEDRARALTMLRTVANRIGAAMIVVHLLISSALMARVNHEVSLAGFSLSALIGLYMVWRIFRTPGEF